MCVSFTVTMGFESVSLMQWCLIFLWSYREISAEVLNHAITLAKVLKGFVIGFCALKTYILPNALTKTDIRAIKHTLTTTALAFDQRGEIFIKSFHQHFGHENDHIYQQYYTFLNDLSLKLQGHTHMKEQQQLWKCLELVLESRPLSKPSFI